MGAATMENTCCRRFLKKVKVELPYDPATPLLGIYPDKTIIWKGTCTPVLVAALFTKARTWKQPKCPSTEQCIKKMWCVYSVTKKNELSRWWSRRTCAHLLQELQNYSSLLNNHQQENAGSHQKKISHIRGQRSHSKMVGGAKSHLESNPIPVRDAQRVQTKPCVHQDPETPQRPSQTCVWLSCGGTGPQWPAAGAGTLGAATWVTQPVA